MVCVRVCVHVRMWEYAGEYTWPCRENYHSFMLILQYDDNSNIILLIFLRKFTLPCIKPMAQHNIISVQWQEHVKVHLSLHSYIYLQSISHCIQFWLVWRQSLHHAIFINKSTWKGWIQLLSALFWTWEKTKLCNCSKGDKFSECLWAKATVKEADFLLCKDQTNAKLSHCFGIALVIWFHCNTEGTELYAPNPRYLNLFFTK